MYTEQEETREVQEQRTEHFEKKGHQQFTLDGRKADITVDLLLQARAKMAHNRVNGPEDTVVSEMIKQLPLEKIYTTTKCFRERFNGPDGGSKIVQDCETGVLVETRCGTEERDQELQLKHGGVVHPTMFLANLDILMRCDPRDLEKSRFQTLPWTRELPQYKHTWISCDGECFHTLQFVVHSLRADRF